MLFPTKHAKHPDLNALALHPLGGGAAQERHFNFNQTVTAMRMIGIGLMGFLLAGVALLLSTMNVLDRGQHMLREITIGPQLVFEHRLPAQADGDHSAEVLRSNPVHPVILSGFPAYQSVAFTFPKDAHATSGYLQINATAQVLVGVEGVLRISIDGTRRGALLLHPGEARKSLQIPLSPADFAGDQLVVSFSLQGTNPQEMCGADDGIGAIVEIETTSALHLTFDTPLVSARDRFHAWGDVVRVAWPSWLQKDEQLRRLLLGVQVKHHGLRTHFLAADEKFAFNTTALREALDSIPGQTSPLEEQSWFVAAEGANSGVRTFRESTSWRARYALSDGSGQRIPAHLDLHVALGDLFGDHSWSLTVTLNNRLLAQDSFDGAERAYVARIELPTNWQEAENQLEVVATTTARNKGICDRGPELVAEMLPATQLVLGEDIYTSPLEALRIALSHLDPIHVSLMTSLTPIQAEQFADWLAQITPQSAGLKPAHEKAQIVIAGAGDLQRHSLFEGKVWVLTQGKNAGEFNVHPIRPGQAFPNAGPFMLIAPDGFDVRGVAS